MIYHQCFNILHFAVLVFAQSLKISFKVLGDRLKKMFITLADEGILISFLILQIMRAG